MMYKFLITSVLVSSVICTTPSVKAKDEIIKKVTNNIVVFNEDCGVRANIEPGRGNDGVCNKLQKTTTLPGNGAYEGVEANGEADGTQLDMSSLYWCGRNEGVPEGYETNVDCRSYDYEKSRDEKVTINSRGGNKQISNLWRNIYSDVRITNKAMGIDMCLDVKGGSGGSNGAAVHMWKCDGGYSEYWTLVRQSNGKYKMYTSGSESYGISRNWFSSYFSIITNTYDSFEFEHTGDGNIIHGNSNSMLAPENSKGGNGTLLKDYYNFNGAKRVWQIWGTSAQQ